MKRWIIAAGLLIALALIVWLSLRPTSTIVSPASVPTYSQPTVRPAEPTAPERLLEGYADPATPPIEDLRKLHRVLTGYFSVIKDASRNPIGGNADLAAALRGENPNRTVFVHPGHAVFSPDGLLRDRWDSPDR